MLNHMDAESTIAALVELALPRFSPENRVLVMSLEIDISKHSDKLSKNPDQSRYRNVHLMFHRPNNYTKVMWSVTEVLESSDSIHKWEVKSNHDSCWKTDGLATPLFELVHGLVNQIDNTLPHKSFDIEISFGAFGCPNLREVEGAKYDRDARTFTIKKFGKVIAEA
jgi:hypothetical protein